MRSEAHNRPIYDWLHRINSGQLRLPSFQRGVAWDYGRVSSMLSTIINDLPLGITLILEVGDREQFHSRPLESAPNSNAKVTEHLLDGQQRLTALWRALKDNTDVTYFVHVPPLDEDPHNDDAGMTVHAVKRWQGKRGRKPLWADSPVECRKRGLVPVRLLDPDSQEVDSWVREAFPTKAMDEQAPAEERLQVLLMERAMAEKQNALKDQTITPLRERLRHFNLPFLGLPATTDKETALRVFINMNTNAKPLKAYDIVVAELENATGERLRDRLDMLVTENPRLRRYFDDVGDAVLQTAALLQGRQPSQKGYFELDYPKFITEWALIERGLGRLSVLLAGEGIWDSARVPTGPALPVGAALLAVSDETGDRRAYADQLVRRYLWSSFFTDRYRGSAATRAMTDHAALRAVLDGSGTLEDVPAFDRTQYPLPSRQDLLEAGWSKKADRLGRAVLAASTYFGARDFADNTSLSDENIGQREYHHLFPDKLLKDAGINSFLALNCALITWKTNRTIGRLDPIRYLEDRAQNAPDSRDVRDRLETHLVPYEELSSAGPYPMELSGAELARTVAPDFSRFLEARASLIAAAAEALTGGQQPRLHEVLNAVVSRPRD